VTHGVKIAQNATHGIVMIVMYGRVTETIATIVAQTTILHALFIATAVVAGLSMTIHASQRLYFMVSLIATCIWASS